VPITHSILRKRLPGSDAPRAILGAHTGNVVRAAALAHARHKSWCVFVTRSASPSLLTSECNQEYNRQTRAS
jgi:hypothetical protein